MTWLVFAVSGLLILAGAVSLISGAPIIQLERGWAEVISGAVAVSGGGVTFALGVVLLRLQALHAAFAQAGVAAVSVAAEAASFAPAAVPETPPLELRPTVDPQEAEAPTADATEPSLRPAQAETRHGLWKRVRRPTDPTIKEEPVLSTELMADEVDVSAPPIFAGLLGEPARPAGDVEDALPRDTAPVMEIQSRRDATSTVDEPAIPEPSVAPAAAPSSRWFKPPSLRERTTQPTGVEPVPAPAQAEPEATPSSEPPPFLADPADELVADPASKAVRVDPAVVEPPAEKATIVGRYQAGVASYVMFSDGTINVETEGGDVHRFESMDELKAFIAKQEASVM